MTIADEWNEVAAGLALRQQYVMLRPALAAIESLVGRIRSDPAFGDVHPTLSHAWLLLSRGLTKWRVCVTWRQRGEFLVYFVDPNYDFSEAESVSDGEILVVLREYCLA